MAKETPEAIILKLGIKQNARQNLVSSYDLQSCFAPLTKSSPRKLYNHSFKSSGENCKPHPSSLWLKKKKKEDKKRLVITFSHLPLQKGRVAIWKSQN